MKKAINAGIGNSKIWKELLSDEDISFKENKNGFYEIEFDSDQDVFDLGFMFGREVYKEKNQSFLLHRDYADILQKAIEQAEEENHVSNTSIQIRDSHMPAMKEIYFFPTGIGFLFNCFNIYGQMVAESKLQAQTEKNETDNHSLLK